jgi:CRISPR-associated exonuclease Cas4
MYTEDELLPISALQHLSFCERQWGLIHLEGLWDENRLTAEGHILHDRAHEGDTETRGDVRTARGLRLRSLRLGLVGIADVVEFHRAEGAGISLAGVPGLWQPVIVEYKRGKPKIGHEDELQLCAQALCLEEMLKVSIQNSSLFYGQPRRRYDVVFTEQLRGETESLAFRLHELNDAGVTPLAEYSQKCKNCSLLNLCLPKAASGHRDVHGYMARAVSNMESDEE